jgi:hypothetical protein
MNDNKQKFPKKEGFKIPGFTGNIGYLDSLPDFKSQIIPGLLDIWGYMVLAGQLSMAVTIKDPQVAAKLDSTRFYAKVLLKSDDANYARSALAVIMTINHSKKSMKDIQNDIDKLAEYKGIGKLQQFIRQENILVHRAGLKASLLGAAAQAVLYKPMSLGVNPMTITSAEKFIEAIPIFRMTEGWTPTERNVPVNRFAGRIAEEIGRHIEFQGEFILGQIGDAYRSYGVGAGYISHNLVPMENLITESGSGLSIVRTGTPYRAAQLSKMDRTAFTSNIIYEPIALPESLPEEEDTSNELGNFARIDDLPNPPQDFIWVHRGYEVVVSSDRLLGIQEDGMLEPTLLTLEEVRQFTEEQNLKPRPLQSGPVPLPSDIIIPPGFFVLPPTYYLGGSTWGVVQKTQLPPNAKTFGGTWVFWGG